MLMLPFLLLGAPSAQAADGPLMVAPPPLSSPSFGSCYNPGGQPVFRLTVVNKSAGDAYIAYDIYGKANSFVKLGLFQAGETKVFPVSEEGTLRKFISDDNTQWQQKSGTHVLSIAGHTANHLLCKGSASVCKFDDTNANGVQKMRMRRQSAAGRWMSSPST